jgi:hypothetical protein
VPPNSCVSDISKSHLSIFRVYTLPHNPLVLCVTYERKGFTTPSEWHTYTIHVSIISRLKNPSLTHLLPFIYTDWSEFKQITSIRDHSFQLDSPGQSMSWKEQVSLMFCTRGVRRQQNKSHLNYFTSFIKWPVTTTQWHDCNLLICFGEGGHATQNNEWTN